MAGDYLEMAFRMAAALVAGGLIGLERSHRGRPAGFRTHARLRPPADEATERHESLAGEPVGAPCSGRLLLPRDAESEWLQWL